MKLESTSLSQTHPLQDLWLFFRGPFRFARHLVRESWAHDSNWMLFKGFFLLIVITSLLHLAQWPGETAAWGITALELGEWMGALSQNGEMSPEFLFFGGAEVSQALSSPEATGLMLWVLSLIRGLGFLIFPVSIALTAVLLSSIAFLYLRFWKNSHQLSYPRVLLLFCYSHCWLLLGLVFSHPLAIVLITLGVLVYWCHCLMQAVKDFALPGERPRFFGLLAFLLFARGIVFLVGLPLA